MVLDGLSGMATLAIGEVLHNFGDNLRFVLRLIECCEHCNPEGAEIPFDNILDRVTGSDPSVTITLWSLGRSARAADVRYSKSR